MRKGGKKKEGKQHDLELDNEEENGELYEGEEEGGLPFESLVASKYFSCVVKVFCMHVEPNWRCDSDRRTVFPPAKCLTFIDELQSRYRTYA